MKVNIFTSVSANLFLRAIFFADKSKESVLINLVTFIIIRRYSLRWSAEYALWFARMSIFCTIELRLTSVFVRVNIFFDLLNFSKTLMSKDLRTLKNVLSGYFTKALSIAIAIWNLSLYPKEMQSEYIGKITEIMTASRKDSRLSENEKVLGIVLFQGKYFPVYEKQLTGR